VPSTDHEVLIELFRGRPALAADLLAGPLRGAVPAFAAARLSASEFPDIAPTEYRADAVVTLDTATGTALAVVVEVQRRLDKRKLRSWPVYVSTLRARLNCPVALLVLCPVRSVAKWCSAPIAIGPPGSMLTPVALGPDDVPIVTDPDFARQNPELAVLSALAHGDLPDPIPVFEALLAGLDDADPVQAETYTDVVFAGLSKTARQCLEGFMSTTSHRYRSDFARRYFDQGKAEGKAEGKAVAVLTILDDRGVAVPEAKRAEIEQCTDMQQLDAWLHRALTARTIVDLDA
jgi:hypothetical protein